MSPALYYTVVRYLVAWGCGVLVQHGWSVANLDGATMDAVTQIAVGVVGALAMTCIGALTSTVRWMTERLKAHHPVALVDAAAAVPGVTKIEATPAIAKATANDNVVAAPQSGAA